MRKYFLSLTMVLLGLLAGVSTMQAVHLDPPYTPEQAETMGFWARLTAKPAATTKGSGKVFVISEDDYKADPADGDYQAVSSSYDGYGDIYVTASLIDANVPFKIFAKANDGSYFTGWSFTEGYTDLMVMDNKVEVEPSSVKDHANIRNHTVFAAFEPIQLVSYMDDGVNETYDDGAGHWICEKIITFRAASPGDDNALASEDGIRHFKLPVVTAKVGTTGTWETSVTSWELGTNIEMYGSEAVIMVPVKFTAPNSDPGEYAATLTLETKAGVKLTAYLYARTPGAAGEATRYNSSKVQLEAGNLTTLIANAAAGDIIKLNGDYSSAVELNKNITFDLNGFALSNALTVSGGEVTLAYSPFGGSIDGDVAVTGGKLTVNGGIFKRAVNVSAGAELVQNGATFNGELNNFGTTTTTDGTYLNYVRSNGTLIVDGGFFYNDWEFSEPAITVNGGTATIKRGMIGDEANGVNYYGIKINGGSVVIEKGATILGQEYAIWNAGGSLTVNGGKFDRPAMMVDGAMATFVSAYFKHNEEPEDQAAVAALGKPAWRNTAGPEFREGYNFFVGDQAAAQAANVSVCRIGPVAYSSLEEALAYANNSGNDAIIIMENDYTLKAGYYTLPANATLVVPISNEQSEANPIVPRESGMVAAVSFRRLIFEDGVNMTVEGTFELTGTQYGVVPNMGVPGGNYGHLILKPGSHMTINDGGELRAWGYITGDGTKDAEGNYLSGEIDARRGAVVREMFQMGDWKGGDISLTLVMPQEPYLSHQQKTHLFPINSYFIQNIESPVKYHPGSSLLCAASVNVSSISAYANSIKVVGKEGEPAMFLMNEMADAENTWVRKYYDAKNDKQVYEVNSGAQLGSVVIDLGTVPGAMFGGSGSYSIQLDSRKFVLPLTNNFKIHLLSGNMQFTQSTACLPGMEVEVDKESEVAVIKNDDASIVSGALYFYDADQWSYKGKGYVGNSGHFGEIVQYSATWDLGTNGAQKRPEVRNVSSPAAIGDATLNVHGTFRMGANCAVYTSWAKDESKLALKADGTGGAHIFSTNEDAGTFIFDAAAPDFDGITFTPGHEGEFNLDYMTFGQNCLVNYDHNNHSESNYPIKEVTVQKHDEEYMFGWELFTSAKLQNGTGAAEPFATTEGTEAGKSYCYMNNQWTLMDVAPENECFMKDNYGTFYAKPAEYVAVAARVEAGEVVGNADHTFSDAAGAGRLFILMSDCQWWEVEKKDNLYHCIHPQNDTYYYWDETEEKWMEQRFTITWKNYDGSVIKSYMEDPTSHEIIEVPYSVTYGTMAEYLGSNPTRPADIDYTYSFSGWSPALGIVTNNVTYTATYTAQPRKYTVIFTNEGGTEIERHFLSHNEVPVCENVPTKIGYTLEWEPAIAAVTGDATYRATWLPEPPTEYEVTFFDYDGTSILKQSNVAVGEMPVAPADPANKPATSEFTYEFNHWSPALEVVSATSIKSYTAVYSEVAVKYNVRFENEDGSEIETNQYAWGETPVCSATPTKANTAQYTYTFAWNPQIQTVQGAAIYHASFTATTNRYTVTLKSNMSGVCTFTGAGTYDYGTNVNVNISYDATKYVFNGWSDSETAASRTISGLSEDVTLTANFSDKPDVPENKTVAVGETWNVAPATEVNDLVLNSNGITSGQIENASNLTIVGNCYYDLTQTFTAGKWYAVAVPWEVVASEIQADGVALSWHSGNYLAYYDGAIRAAQGKVDACWNYVTNGDVLQPGRLYMIYLQNNAGVLRFPKKAGSTFITNTTSVQAYAAAETTDANWNGIANPAVYHGYLNAGATDGQGQVFNAAEEKYELFEMDDNKLFVGQPIFVQAPVAKTIEVNASVYSAAPARRVQSADSPVRYDVRLTADNKQADRLIVHVNKDKEEDKYVIGKDLVKFGVSTKVAQMWVNRYDSKLCINTVAPEGEATNFPLSIFAPKDGEYEISLQPSVVSNQTLYLTFNGEAIWNLSESAYVANLQEGTHHNYGLRVSARAPQATTGIDEAVVDAKGETRKVLINGQVFIIRGEKVYSIDGQLVK